MKRIHVHHPCIYEKIKHVLNAFEFIFKLKTLFLVYALSKNFCFHHNTYDGKSHDKIYFFES